MFRPFAQAAALILPLTLSPVVLAKDAPTTDMHQLASTGGLIKGSTLELYGEALRVAEYSRTEKGFYALETLQAINGKNRYRGFVQQADDVTLTVLQNRDGSITKIYQSNTGTEIKTVKGERLEPLRVPESTRAQTSLESTSQYGWTSTSVPKANNEPLTSPQPGGPYLTVGTLVLFDPRLPARVNNIGRQFEADLQAAENLTETIFNNSQLEYLHSVVAAHAINLPSTTDRYINTPSGDILDELVASGEVQRLKDLYHADVVHYIGITDEVCGQAFVASEIDTNNEFNSTSLDYHVAYTNYGCLGNGTFAHELGHNLALYHDRYTLANNEDGAGDSFDNHIPYGYIAPEGEYFTTMAYQSSCTDVFTSAACESAPVFSNPDVDVEGVPAGQPASVVEAANASAALDLTLPWAAGYQRALNFNAASLTPNGDGSANLSWGSNTTDTYILLDRSCQRNRFFTAAQIAAGTEITGASADGTLLDVSNFRACVLATQPNFGTGYYVEAEYQANLDQSGSSAAYLLVQDNVIDAQTDVSSYTVDFAVSDTSVANGDIALATYTAADGSRPTLSDGIAQANEWFSVSISGSGANRTATITLDKTPVEIAAELDESDLRNPFQLPLALVNTNYTEYGVSSVVWLENQNMGNGLAYGFFESGEFLLDGREYNIVALVNNVPSGATLNVSQAGDITLPNASFTVETPTDNPNQRRITVTGDPAEITAKGTWQLVADWGNRADQQVTMELVGYAEDGNRVTDVNVLSELNEDNDILLEVVLAELPDNSFWDTLEIRRLVPGGNDVVYDTPQSQDGNRFTFNLGRLEAGDYEFQIGVDYVDGGRVVYSLDLSVAAGSGTGSTNAAPTVSIDGPTGTVDVGETFTLTADASDPDGDDLSYQWRVSSGGSADFDNPTARSVSVSVSDAGDYTIQVTVTDSQGASSTASFQFEATGTTVLPPVDSGSGGSSGGSTGWWLLLLAGFGWMSRKRA